MTVSKNRQNDVSEYYDDEIDLKELFRKIWKWKWLTIGLTVVVTAATFFYTKTRPDEFTTKATIRIGRIADIPIERKEGIGLYLYSKAKSKYTECIMNIKINKKKTKKTPELFKSAKIIPIIFISSSDSTPEKSYNCLNQVLSIIIKRHNKLFKDGLKEMKNNINSTKSKQIINPQLILESYNFPTTIINKPEIVIEPDSKKLMLKTVIAFFISLFFGIFLSLIVDLIKKKESIN